MGKAITDSDHRSEIRKRSATSETPANSQQSHDMDSEQDSSDSDADPKHSKEFSSTFTAEHMSQKSYPSPAIDPGEYSPDSTAETRKAEVQQLFKETTAKDRCPIASPEFDSSWRHDTPNVKVKEDTGPTYTYHSEDDDSDSSKATHSVHGFDFQSQPSSVRDAYMKPSSRSLSSMTASSSNPSSTRASSSSSSRPEPQLPVSNRLDHTDQQRPSQRRRKNGDDTRAYVRPLRSHPPVVTVNERAARSHALRLAQQDPYSPEEISIASLYALKHKGRTIEGWAKEYGTSALAYGITPQTQMARQRFNELLNYIQGALVIAGLPPVDRLSFALVDYADAIYAAISDRNDELIREFAAKL